MLLSCSCTTKQTYWPSKNTSDDTSKQQARVVITSMGLQTGLWGKYSWKFYLNVMLLLAGSTLTVLGATSTILSLIS